MFKKRSTDFKSSQTSCMLDFKIWSEEKNKCLKHKCKRDGVLKYKTYLRIVMYHVFYQIRSRERDNCGPSLSFRLSSEPCVELWEWGWTCSDSTFTCGLNLANEVRLLCLYPAPKALLDGRCLQVYLSCNSAVMTQLHETWTFVISYVQTIHSKCVVYCSSDWVKIKGEYNEQTHMHNPVPVNVRLLIQYAIKLQIQN